jgi:hypothetical protein
VIPFVIDMMNSVHIFTNKFTDGINSVGNPVGKNDTSLFFLLCFNFFPMVIPSIYTEGIFLSVKSLENLPMEIFSQYFRLYLSIFW